MPIVRLRGVPAIRCAARVSRVGAARRAAGSFDDLAHASPDRSRNAPGRVHMDAAAVDGCGAGQRQDGRHRRDHARGPRGTAQHRAARHGRALPGLLAKLAQASGIKTLLQQSIASILRRSVFATSFLNLIVDGGKRGPFTLTSAFQKRLKRSSSVTRRKQRRRAAGPPGATAN